MNDNKSEVARLRAQLAADYDAAQQAMNGFAIGAAHQIITARMENMGRCHEQLSGLVGAEEAAKILIETMDGKDRQG